MTGLLRIYIVLVPLVQLVSSLPDTSATVDRTFHYHVDLPDKIQVGTTVLHCHNYILLQFDLVN